MNKTIKKKWLAALRGKSSLGEYIQCTSVLSKDIGRDHVFCCLGVFCNELPEEDGKWSYYKDFNGFNRRLSTVIMKKYKICNDEEDTLIHMNDSGKSFTEIADWIEKNL